MKLEVSDYYDESDKNIIIPYRKLIHLLENDGV